MRYTAWLACILIFIFSGYTVYYIHKLFHMNPFASVWIQATILLITILVGFSYLNFFRSWRSVLHKLILCVPILVMFVGYGTRVYARVTHKKSSLELLRDDFRKMAEYVKDNTQKDALFLIPYDMPFHGFRIFSERSLIVSGGDGGIVFFDLPGAIEFEKRLSAVQHYKINPTEEERRQIPYDIRNAVVDYSVDYVLFPNYISPMSSKFLKRVNATDFLVLYEVRKPVL